MRSLPTRAKDGTGGRAPGSAAEVETLPHVLGSYPKGQLLRIARYNRVRTIIAEEVASK